MCCKRHLGVAVLSTVAICFAFACIAEPSGEGDPVVLLSSRPEETDLDKAWIGTWVGKWQSLDGSAGGKIQLKVHKNEYSKLEPKKECNAVITFLSGAPTFGTDPFIPQVAEQTSADQHTFFGARNGASFHLSLTLMANGIELRTDTRFPDLEKLVPDNLRAQLVKQ